VATDQSAGRVSSREENVCTNPQRDDGAPVKPREAAERSRKFAGPAHAHNVQHPMVASQHFLELVSRYLCPEYRYPAVRMILTHRQSMVRMVGITSGRRTASIGPF